MFFKELLLGDIISDEIYAKNKFVIMEMSINLYIFYIKKRIKLMPDPEKIIIKRIMKELLSPNTEKHKLFVE